MKSLPMLLGLLTMTVAHAVVASSLQLDYIHGLSKQIQFIEQQTVWPGFHPAATPSIIQFESKNALTAYAIDLKPGVLPWQLVETSPYPVYFLADANPLKHAQNGTFTQVEGQRSFIDVEDEGSLVERENVSNKFMLVRAAHYLTQENVIDKKYASYANTPYDSFNNAAIVKLVYLEDAALTAAQQADMGRAEEALRDAVAIHQYRNQLLSPSARAYENGSEIMSGTPVYISWASKQLSEEDYRKMTQRTGCMPLESLIGASGMIDCVVSGFPAFASSVYGHALDKKLTGPSWKQNVETQFKSISQIAIDYYHFTDAQARTMAEQAMKKSEYHYERIVRIVDHGMLPYLESMAIARHKYQTMPGIEFHMPIELGEVITIMGALSDLFSEIYMLDSKTRLVEDVNIPRQDGDPAQVFFFDHVPYMSLNYTAKDFLMDAGLSYTELKLTEKAKFIIDGVSISAIDFLRGRKSQSFHKIVISDSNMMIPLTFPAKLDASDGVIKLIESDSPANGYNLKQTLLKQLSKQYQGHLNAKK